MEDFNKLFTSFSSLKVGVIGDVMLDTYMWGQVVRISPEAPVPVVSLQRKEYRIGGAGNVAMNCKSLGAQVTILSVIGDDTEGSLLEKLFQASSIDATYLVKARNRVTTNKMRIISRNQQMMRLDEEITDDLDNTSENDLLEKIKNYISANAPEIIIFEDYNKGVLSERIIKESINLCKQSGVLIAVDPKRNNFFTYKEVDVFKPNLKEVKEALNLLTDNVSLHELQNIHKELENILRHNISFITLSEKGVFYQQGENSNLIPSHLRSVSDVSGAGDTVIAVAAMVYAATKDPKLMARISNIAGGMVCEEVGTVTINKEKLLHECELLLS